MGQITPETHPTQMPDSQQASQPPAGRPIPAAEIVPVPATAGADMSAVPRPRPAASEPSDQVVPSPSAPNGDVACDSQDRHVATKSPPPALTAGSAGILGHVDVLSEAETEELKTCEAIVACGWNTFADVGMALASIRDKELYRVNFTTFEAYCRAKWQYARRYVHHLISAAQLFKHLCASGYLVDSCDHDG